MDVEVDRQTVVWYRKIRAWRRRDAVPLCTLQTVVDQEVTRVIRHTALVECETVGNGQQICNLFRPVRGKRRYVVVNDVGLKGGQIGNRPRAFYWHHDL